MKFAILTLGLMLTSNVFAANRVCEGQAKYAAIRAYKAEAGTVQGSDGIDYSARQLKVTKTSAQYEVSISDNNEDGESWTVQYVVGLKISADKECSIQFVRKQD